MKEIIEEKLKEVRNLIKVTDINFINAEYFWNLIQIEEHLSMHLEYLKQNEL